MNTLKVKGFQVVQFEDSHMKGREVCIIAETKEGARIEVHYTPSGDGFVVEDNGEEIHGFQAWDKLTDDLYREVMAAQLIK